MPPYQVRGRLWSGWPPCVPTSRTGGRYYGYYSNVCRGKRKETEGDGVPCILEAERNSKEYRKNWAQLIQKIYEVDPLTCPEACPEPVEGCRGTMRIISFIEDEALIKTILKHLGL
jgi:hypothetical protein